MKKEIMISAFVLLAGIAIAVLPNYATVSGQVTVSDACGSGRVVPPETRDDGEGSPTPCPTNCDDSNECTAEELLNGGTCQANCQYTDVIQGTPCDDGLFCTVSDACNGAGECSQFTSRDCADQDVCTTDSCNEGSDMCVNDPITACGPAEGCCPSGCNNNNDNDCQPLCGNNIIEAGETCDDGQSNTNTPCTPGYGSSCTYCDTSCNSQTVNGPFCGDSAVNGPETCELPNMIDNTFCPQTTIGCEGAKTMTRDAFGDCDSLCGCTEDTFGQAVCVKDSCQATCDDDTDCPSGQACNLNSCGCVFICGNGIVDSGETCDTAISSGPGSCPTTCIDQNECTADSVIGSGCQATCSNTPVPDQTPCTGGVCVSGECTSE